MFLRILFLNCFISCCCFWYFWYCHRISLSSFFFFAILIVGRIIKIYFFRENIEIEEKEKKREREREEFLLFPSSIIIFPIIFITRLFSATRECLIQARYLSFNGSQRGKIPSLSRRQTSCIKQNSIMCKIYRFPESR